MELIKNKKIFLFSIPVSICNFRCHYCYLSHRAESFRGIHPPMKYSPEHFAKAMNPKRVGGYAFANFCADGETFLVKDIDLYVKAFVEQGHFAEVVTNLTVTKVLDKFLSWDTALLKHLEFKCSFHYLELKKKGLLETFAENVNKIWEAGASANIEITPSDELIPYIDEVKKFSLEHFGALPHITIARNDKTSDMEYLTDLSIEEYDKVWSQFDSNFWKFKKSIFAKKQECFCYAGSWSLYVNLCTGIAIPCYFGKSLGDVFANPDQPLPERPVGKCQIAHCYNGHALLTMGLIPGTTNVRYGDIRDRTKTDGTHWLQPELKEFFNSQLCESNEQLNYFEKKAFLLKRTLSDPQTPNIIKRLPKSITYKVLGEEKYNKLKNSIKGNQ